MQKEYSLKDLNGVPYANCLLEVNLLDTALFMIRTTFNNT